MSKSLPVRGQVACCEPLGAAPLGEQGAVELSRVFKALADPARLRLLSLILNAEGRTACVCELTGALDLSQPTISHHLKVLHGSGLLEREKRGVWVHYTASTLALRHLAELVTAPA